LSEGKTKMKNTHRNNTLSHLAALAARRFATIALLFAASAGALPRLASAQTPTLTVIGQLVNLPGATGGGTHTDYGVVLASDGNFYGITTFGGSANFGTIFKLTPTGTITTLVNFTGPNGAVPRGGLIQASDGNLYGTTSGGGTTYGTVFKVTLDGTLTTIFTFTYDPVTFANNGFYPEAALVQGTDGNLYGTTLNGGTHPTTSNGGTIFKMSTTGALLVSTTLNASGGEPANPHAPLIQGSDGNFYGTSPVGGNTQTDNGGAVFRCTPGGVVTVLHAFSDPEGRDPEGGVVQGSDGNFYGTTEAGGSANFGVVYRVTPAGGFTVLHTFTGTAAPDESGGQPFGEMILARDGNFYGTTRGGGAFSLGTIFKLTPAGVFTIVYNFPEGTNGGQPQGALLPGSDGNFYGTTTGRGLGNGSTVFRLNISPNGGTLGNISTRMRVLTDDKVLIGGFIITGTDPKSVIIRGIGPSLNGAGVTLADPTLELHQGSTTLATNDNWKINDQTGQSQQAAIEATTIPPTNDLESAILATLSPGAYTAILAGKNGGTGVGLVEVYDLSRGAIAQLANISTRGFVDTGDNVMIGGLIVGAGSGGGNVSKVIVRALGPSVPVVGALADPTLELHDANGATLATNDNWKINDQTGQSQQAEIEATTIPPSNDLESALVAILGPGNYTATVRGKNNTTGVGLVEIYNLQ